MRYCNCNRFERLRSGHQDLRTPKTGSADVEKGRKVQEVKQINEWKAMQGETSDLQWDR